VENVHLCIEVKTSVGKGEIEDARAKQKTVQDLRPIGTERPAYALVGFESESSVDTIAQHLRASPNLDIACILNEGIIAGPAQLLHAPDHEGKSDTNFTVGMACPPTEVAEAILQTADSADPRTPINVVEHGGANYSIVRRGRNRVVADPARALLLFCDALLRILSNSDSRSPAFSYYIDAEARKITALP
jgi:hypothetical protein